MDENISRDNVIVQTSIIGILANVFLASFKAFVGLTSNSIAIVMDAVNNLSDAASSVITIIGTKLAGKAPDRKHPFGYGRIEYLSALVISLIVLYAGITAFTESVKAIITPETPDYSIASLIIVGVAVAVKIALGLYVRHTGTRVNSDSLINSGADALLDTIISASTLAAAGIYLIFHVSLEAWLGAVIALVIIKSGFEMIRDTLSKILGERAEPDLARDIKETLNSFPEVLGAYDLVLHNYGPDHFNGSVHIEVPDTISVDELDRLNRSITIEVYKKHNVILTAIGVYSFNTKDDDAAAAKQRVTEIIKKEPHILQMHGFYLDKENKSLRFDIVVSFDAKDRSAVYQKIVEMVKAEFPDYTLQIAMDTDFSEDL